MLARFPHRIPSPKHGFSPCLLVVFGAPHTTDTTVMQFSGWDGERPVNRLDLGLSLCSTAAARGAI